ncbi:MAG TPA: FMN-binding negative transcriptional regulator [Solirubrobacteraceae bacterium]|jgi:transcriptional regulator|nr:FMN-binding negative transcriptional regulator [Solirubrobacteraceae bacterium]
MYLPKHLRADDAETAMLLSGLRAADLVSATADGPYATFLPLLHDSSGGEFGRLLGHVARKNDHWRLEPIGESLVIAHGPDAYITPSWYETKMTTGRVVPTWNYVTAHIYGELIVHDDPVWLEWVVRLLTHHHEAPRTEPWRVDDAPRPYLDAQLKAIVGLELRITRMEVKAKLEQGEPAADIDGVIAGLRERGDHESAEAMSRARRRR